MTCNKVAMERNNRDVRMIIWMMTVTGEKGKETKVLVMTDGDDNA